MNRPSCKCEWCGKQFMGSTHGTAKNRWCSEYCRKQLGYSSTCEWCGGVVPYSAKPEQSKVCVECYEGRYADRNQRIINAFTEGEPGWVIAEREGMTASQVLSLVSCYRLRYGMPIPLHRRRNRELWPEIERQWRDGKTAREIADALSISTGNVYAMVQSMRKAGIDLPRRAKVLV